MFKGRNWLAMLLGVCLCASGPAAFASEIRDGADFFTPETRTAVSKQLQEIENRFQVGFTVETVATPNAELARKLEGASKQQRNEAFAKAARLRAQESHAHGVFVMVWRNPSHLNVEFSRKLVDRGFTQADQKGIRDALLAGFQAKKYDQGLRDSVNAFRTVVERRAGAVAKSSVPAPVAAPAGHPNPHQPHPHQPGANPPGENGGFLSEFGGMGIVGLIIAVVGVFIVIRLIGAVFRALAGGGGAGQPGYGAGMGGGGLFGSLLTGMFGAMAGHYIYDNFFGNHSHDNNAMGADLGSRADGNEWGDNGWGDSGGGDFGGGDFGGGDFGGGDFGGGDF